MSAAQRLAAELQRQRAPLIALLRDLVATVRGGERETQAFVHGRLEELGCRVESFAYQPTSLDPAYEIAFRDTADPAEHLCVVGELPGDDDAASLLLFAHPDGETPHGLDRWRHDPFGGEIEGGRLYGWGVADDLVGIATMIGSIELLRGAQLLPRGRLLLASTPSKRRAQGIVAVLDRDFLADAAVYWHPAESGAGLEEIKGVSLGLLKFTIDIAGRPPDTREPSHTPFAHRGVDPLALAWQVWRALSDLAEQRANEIRYPPLQQRVGRSTHLHLAALHCGDIEAPTRMADRCRLSGSITFPPGETARRVQQQVEQTLTQLGRSDPWLRDHPPVLVWTMGTEASEIPLDHPLYQTVSRVVTAVTGTEPQLNPLHAGSDIRNPRLHRGIPTVGLGSLGGDLSQTGHTDEWVDIDDYLRAVHAGSRIALEWGNSPPPGRE